jgi:hypothetical protein
MWSDLSAEAKARRAGDLARPDLDRAAYSQYGVFYNFLPCEPVGVAFACADATNRVLNTHGMLSPVASIVACLSVAA